MIHGAVDGYSWMIVYLRCADSNMANTVLELFMEGVQDFPAVLEGTGELKM